MRGLNSSLFSLQQTCMIQKLGSSGLACRNDGEYTEDR